MQQEIINKLKSALDETIHSENQTIYILVLIRKLLELNPDSTSYKTLKFCCDWAVHPISSGPEAQAIVRQWDRYQDLDETRSNVSHTQRISLDPALLEIVGETNRLFKFRNELSSCLKLHGLDSKLTDEDQSWAGFLSYFLSVITDCPLKFVSQGLKLIDVVAVKVVGVNAATTGDGGGVRLVVEWSWLVKTTGLENKVQQYF